MNNNYEQRQKIYDTFQSLAYYIIIGLVSLVSVIFLPMISSELIGGMAWPNSPVEWAIWIVSRLLIAGLNIIIFYCFIKQAVVNIKDNEAYIEANRKMAILEKKKGILPRSPGKFLGKEWSVKGVSIFIASLLSVIVLTEAILKFDLIQFLVYIFTVGIGVVFGYLTMRRHESYWTTEYPAYADYMWDKYEEEQRIAAEKEAALKAEEDKTKKEMLNRLAAVEDLLQEKQASEVVNNA